jgi:hypothetical protein
MTCPKCNDTGKISGPIYTRKNGSGRFFGKISWCCDCICGQERATALSTNFAQGEGSIPYSQGDIISIPFEAFNHFASLVKARPEKEEHR